MGSTFTRRSSFSIFYSELIHFFPNFNLKEPLRVTELTNKEHLEALSSDSFKGTLDPRNSRHAIVFFSGSASHNIRKKIAPCLSTNKQDLIQIPDFIVQNIDIYVALYENNA